MKTIPLKISSEIVEALEKEDVLVRLLDGNEQEVIKFKLKRYAKDESGEKRNKK